MLYHVDNCPSTIAIYQSECEKWKEKKIYIGAGQKNGNYDLKMITVICIFDNHDSAFIERKEKKIKK